MLYLVTTPIGSLEDITLRALNVLRDADLIACEDTRTSAKLLSHYNIDTPRTSYHDHNERQKTGQLIQRMQAGATVALISDAGSPGISDPGFFLVRACAEANIPVQALPGASALIPALTASGLPPHQFVFEGFLPVKKGRQNRLQALSDESRSMVFYESPHRVVKTLGQFADAFGPERPAALARELTKTFEETLRGSLGELKTSLEAQTKIRGEFVIVVGGKEKASKERRMKSPDLRVSGGDAGN